MTEALTTLAMLYVVACILAVLNGERVDNLPNWFTFGLLGIMGLMAVFLVLCLIICGD